MATLFLLLFLLLGLPLLFLFGLSHIITAGFEKVGIAPEFALGVFLLILLGSFFNIPLGRQKQILVEEAGFFGFFKRKQLRKHGIAINVGGAVVPLVIVAYLLFRIPLQQTLIATVLVGIVANRFSKVVPGLGITLSPFIPPIAAALFALILVPSAAAPAAFVAGVLGVLIGADLLNLPRVQRGEIGTISIGGAGVFDGILLVGLAAALLGGLEFEGKLPLLP